MGELRATPASRAVTFEFEPRFGQRRDGRRLIGLDRFLEIGIGNTRDWQSALALVLGQTSITRNAGASRTKRRTPSHSYSAIRRCREAVRDTTGRMSA